MIHLGLGNNAVHGGGKARDGAGACCGSSARNEKREKVGGEELAAKICDGGGGTNLGDVLDQFLQPGYLRVAVRLQMGKRRAGAGCETSKAEKQGSEGPASLGKAPRGRACAHGETTKAGASYRCGGTWVGCNARTEQGTWRGRRARGVGHVDKQGAQVENHPGGAHNGDAGAGERLGGTLEKYEAARITLWIDNMSSMYIFRRMGSKYMEIMAKVRVLQWLLHRLDLFIDPHWLPSAVNVFADKLSRSRDLDNMSVRAAVRRELLRRYVHHVLGGSGGWVHRQLGIHTRERRKVSAHALEERGDTTIPPSLPPVDMIRLTVAKLRRE